MNKYWEEVGKYWDIERRWKNIERRWINWETLPLNQSPAPSRRQWKINPTYKHTARKQSIQKQRTRRPICKDDRPSIVVGRVEIERGLSSQTSGWRHLVSDDYSLISYGRLYWELDSYLSFCILCPRSQDIKSRPGPSYKPATKKVKFGFWDLISINESTRSYSHVHVHTVISHGSGHIPKTKIHDKKFAQ